MNLLCSGPECHRPVYVKTTGLCRSHNAQLLRGSGLTELRGSAKPCTHEGCEAQAQSKGYCRPHYMQHWKYGKTYGPGAIGDCSAYKCYRPVFYNGLCQSHAKRGSGWEIGGSGNTCGVLTCDNVAYNGICRSHRARALKFGLSNEALIEVLGDGTCEACGQKVGSLDIHHDHSCCDFSGSCGRCVVAGLCGPCNRSAGMAKDNPAVLRALADLIERGVKKWD